MKRCLFLLAYIFAALALAAHHGFAKPANAESASAISAIRVEGNQRIESSTVLSYVAIKPGDLFDAAALDQTLKALFESGLFADVTLRQEGRDLVVSVVENPVINQVAFEGNDKLKSEDLQSEIQLRPRTIYTRAKVQSDVDRILTLYRRTGRFAAKVEPKLIKLDQNRVDVVFEIQEGEPTEIKRIAFIGNEHFSSSTLREELITRETTWYNLLSSDDVYDPDRVEADKDKLRRFYARNGYADFEVTSVAAELTPDKSGFFITFTVNEGPRYKIGSIDVQSQIAGIDPETLKGIGKTEKGDWYNTDYVEETINTMTKAIDPSRFPFADVDAKVRTHKDTQTIDLIYFVAEGPKQYVERINVSGNARTQDHVIRREFRLAEGDPLNRQVLKKSEQKVRDLDYFDKVTVQTVAGSAPDRKIIDVNVKEKSTGELSIGGGYSTADGVLGDFNVRERNLLGRGQDLRLSATISQRRQNFNLGFTEPKMFDRDLSGGFDLFDTRNDLQQQSSYVQRQTGFGLRMGYPLSETLSQFWGYRLYKDSIGEIESTASRYIREQAGKRVVSQISQTLSYDTRDSRIEPTEGHIINWVAEIAGIGGDVNFVRNRVNAGKYFPIAENWVLLLFAEGGWVAGWDDQNVMINNRYFLGGDNLRGFRIGGAGPRDLATNDALGGTKYARGTTELSMPLGLPDDLGIKGYIFSDAGIIKDPDVSGATIANDGQLRLSLGAGISWRSPFGPIRVDLAEPILKEDYDDKQLFRLSFGTRF